MQKLQKEVDRLEGTDRCFINSRFHFCYINFLIFLCFLPINPSAVRFVFADDLVGEKEKNKLLADEMEATLHDIQNM